MRERLWTTGEAAAMLKLKLRAVDYACATARAGDVSYVGGRRALTAANIRNLCRHFGRPVPPCCKEDAGGDCVLELKQTSTGGK